MLNQVTLNLMHLSPSTIQAIIEDMREHAETSMTAESAIWKLATQLEALLGKEEADKMITRQELQDDPAKCWNSVNQ